MHSARPCAGVFVCNFCGFLALWNITEKDRERAMYRKPEWMPEQSIRGYMKKQWYETGMCALTVVGTCVGAYMLTPFMIVFAFMTLKAYTDTMDWRMRKEREDARDAWIARRRAEFKARIEADKAQKAAQAPAPAATPANDAAKPGDVDVKAALSGAAQADVPQIAPSTVVTPDKTKAPALKPGA